MRHITCLPSFLRETPGTGTRNVYTTSRTAAVTSATGLCAGDHEFARQPGAHNCRCRERAVAGGRCQAKSITGIAVGSSLRRGLKSRTDCRPLGNYIPRCVSESSGSSLYQNRCFGSRQTETLKRSVFRFLGLIPHLLIRASRHSSDFNTDESVVAGAVNRQKPSCRMGGKGEKRPKDRASLPTPQ